MKIKPLSDRVLIQPNPAEEKTAGGLFIPDTAKEKPLAGKVVAVGPGGMVNGEKVEKSNVKQETSN